MARVTLGSIDDFPKSRGVGVRIGKRRVAVFRIGTAIYAVEDSCPHRGFPVYDGVVRDVTVQCRSHGSCFDLTSGAVQRGPARRGLTTYAASIAGDEVVLELPEES